MQNINKIYGSIYICAINNNTQKTTLYGKPCQRDRLSEMHLHHPDDYLPPCIHRRQVSVCETNRLYVPHVRFPIISGYLANNRKDARSFLRKFLWIFIPYACMEAAYTVMSHFLPVRESVDAITPTVLLDKIFLHPMGPYWYLHTLILCSLIYYITFRYVRLSVVSRLVVTGVCLFALSHWGRIDELLQCPLFPYRHDSEPKRASFYTSLSRHNLRHCSIRNTMLFSRQSG